MNPEPEPGIIIERCTGCGECVSSCSVEALSILDEKLILDRFTCNGCGECVSSCPEEAITIYGKTMPIDEVLKEVLKDKAFYFGSDGGVTVSGGEPLRQSQFVKELFRKCKEEGIGTCLDTCGYASGEALRDVLHYTDNVLFDLKHMNTDKHRAYTGVDNDRIKENARIVSESKADVLFRIPLIGGVNSDEDNIRETANFINSLGEGNKVEILPYHRLGIGKYKILGRDYPGKDFETPDEETIEKLKQIFISYGIQCDIGR